MIGSIVFLHNGEWMVQKKKTAREKAQSYLCSPPSSPKPYYNKNTPDIHRLTGDAFFDMVAVRLKMLKREKDS
jgi:hypothetical protein